MAEPRNFYVYILYREDGVTPFYVGKGRGARWLNHERLAKYERSHKAHIIRQMQDKGLKVPKKKMGTRLTNERACALEIKLISELGREPNGPLTNLTSGGEGAPNLSPESKLKHSINTGLAQKGKRHSLARRLAVSKALKGKRCCPPPTPETTEKRKSSLRKAWARLTAEERLKRGMYGKKHSAETLLKMSESALRRGENRPPEQIKKSIARLQSTCTHDGMKGKKHRPESIEKIRIAAVKIWELRHG